MGTPPTGRLQNSLFWAYSRQVHSHVMIPAFASGLLTMTVLCIYCVLTMSWTFSLQIALNLCFFNHIKDTNQKSAGNGLLLMYRKMSKRNITRFSLGSLTPNNVWSLFPPSNIAHFISHPLVTSSQGRDLWWIIVLQCTNVEWSGRCCSQPLVEV